MIITMSDYFLAIFFPLDRATSDKFEISSSENIFLVLLGLG